LSGKKTRIEIKRKGSPCLKLICEQGKDCPWFDAFCCALERGNKNYLHTWVYCRYGQDKCFVENFNSLNIWDPNSANSAVFMVLRVFELTAWSPSLYAGDTGNALFNYLGIDMPDGLSWVEEAAVLEGHLREIKSIPDMIDIVLFLLLDSVQDYNKSWQLTFGADEP
jgi:hypothetical protein